MRLWRSSDGLGRSIAVGMILTALLNLYGWFFWDHHWWNIIWPPLMASLAYWHLRLGRSRRRYREIRHLEDTWRRSD